MTTMDAMMNRRFTATTAAPLLLLLLLLLSLTQFAVVAQTTTAATVGVVGSCQLNGPVSLQSGLDLYHGISSADATVTIQLVHTASASSSSPWLGFGFGTQMIGSTAVVGIPSSSSSSTVSRYDLTAKDNSGVTPLSDARSTALTNELIGPAADGSSTILQFTKPLVESSSSGEPAVAAGSNSIIYGVGSDATFPSYHGGGGKVKAVELAECLTSGQSQAPVAAAPPTAAPSAAPKGSTSNNKVDLGNGRLQFTFADLENGELSLVLTSDEVAGTVTVDMTVQREAYIAFAFSGDLQMPNSLAVMARPGQDGASGTPQKWDMGGARTSAAIVLAPADRQTLLNATYAQTAGQTRMTFTKLLAEPGEDLAVSLTEDNFFLYAVGPAGNAYVQHDLRDAFTLNFASDGNSNLAVGGGPKNKTLWIVHGVLMAGAWAILVPLAVASSVLRGLLPLPGGAWFQIHRTLNSVAIAATVAGFAIAVHLISREQGSTAVHFKTLLHHRIGLAVFLLAFAQGLSGVFRPHLPHAPGGADDDGDEADPEERQVDDESEAGGAAGKGAAGGDDPKVPPKSPQRVAFEYGHRLLGTATMILGWYNCSSGITAFNRKFDGPDLNPVLWGVVAGLSCTTLVFAIYQRIRPRS
jgi:hypothetical protein